MWNKMKNSVLSNKPNIEFLQMLLIILHPFFILHALHNSIFGLSTHHILRILLAGMVFGLILLRMIIYHHFNLEFRRSICFLFSPFCFWMISLFLGSHALFRSNLIWILFFALYFISGSLLSFNCNVGERKYIAIIIPVLLLLLVTHIFSCGIYFTPDSYSYYDVAKHIFPNFGNIATIRQYVVLSDLNISFPYFYPLLIAIMDWLTGFGIYCGVIINMLVAICTLYLLMRVSQLLCGSVFPGTLATLFLFSNYSYCDELMAARSIPLSILCVSVLLYLLSKWKDPSGRDVFLVGLFAGIGMVVRFDFAVVACFIGIMLFPLFKKTKKNPLKMIIFYAMGLFMFTSVWILYSLICFQTLWMSDNNGTMFMIETYNPLRFFLPTEEIPNLFNDAKGWLHTVLTKRLSNTYLPYSLFMEPTVKISLFFIAICFILGPNKSIKWKQERPNIFRIVISMCIIYIVKTAIIIMVGYGDLRYHVETVMVAFFLILCVAYCVNMKIKRWSRITALVILFVVITQYPPIVGNLLHILNAPVVNNESIFPTVDEKKWASFLRQDSGKSKNTDIKVFVLNNNFDPCRIGALLDLRCYAFLSTPTPERLLYLTTEFVRPDYIIADDSSKWLSTLQTVYELKQIDYNTYRVKLKECNDT